MNIRIQITKLVLPFLPVSMKRHVAQLEAKAMTEVIDSIPVRGGSLINIGEKPYALLELENGTQLIGDLPNSWQRLLFGWLAAEKGVSKDHVKILIDAAARYIYPHMAAGYIRMKWPPSNRKFFHPQHRSMAAEDEKLDEKTKKLLADVFLPQKGWVVIDVGAYLGHGAVSMAQSIGPTGKLLCVEANRANFEVIQEHIRRNQLGQVQVRENAIWSEAGKSVEFHVTERQANAIDAEVVDGETVSVMTTSLPALIEELGTVPNLVSLTVNGAEVEALEGLESMPVELLPERILAPGWYNKDGEPRWKLIKPCLESLGYKVAVTTGGLVFGWRV